VGRRAAVLHARARAGRRIAGQRALRRLCAPAVLLTGHPSAGKSTLAAAAAAALAERDIPSEVLDGDELRARLRPALGFSREDRSRQFERALYLAELLAAHGVVPILALVAPFAADRDRGRRRFAATGWLEVFLDPPEQTCIERDSHGLYARLAAQGGRAAIDAEVFAIYEAPAAPTLRLDTHRLGIAAAAGQIVDGLQQL